MFGRWSAQAVLARTQIKTVRMDGFIVYNYKRVSWFESRADIGLPLFQSAEHLGRHIRQLLAQFIPLADVAFEIVKLDAVFIEAMQKLVASVANGRLVA